MSKARPSRPLNARANAPRRISQTQQCRRQCRDAPDHPGMAVASGIEVVRGPAHPAEERVVHDTAAPQGLDLLEQQGKQDGEETHRRPIYSGGVTAGIFTGADDASGRRRAAVQAVMSAGSGRQKAVEIAQHRGGRTPDEVMPRLARPHRFAGPRNRQEFAAHGRRYRRHAADGEPGPSAKSSGTSNASATSNGSSTSSKPGFTSATTGVTMKPVPVV